MAGGSGLILDHISTSGKAASATSSPSVSTLGSKRQRTAISVDDNDDDDDVPQIVSVKSVNSLSPKEIFFLFYPNGFLEYVFGMHEDPNPNHKFFVRCNKCGKPIIVPTSSKYGNVVSHLKSCYGEA